MANVLALDFQDPAACRTPLETLRRILASGGVIAFPTDTFYGLGADPFNERAVARLFELKQRPRHNPILVLIDHTGQLALFTERIPPAAVTLMNAFWPGPLTLLFPARAAVPAALTAGTGAIGVRQPGDDFPRRLIREVGHPLTAPSANITGGSNLMSVSEVAAALGDAVDAIVTGGRPAGGAPSTVVDPRSTPVRIVREGAVSREQLKACLGEAPA